MGNSRKWLVYALVASMLFAEPQAVKATEAEEVLVSVDSSETETTEESSEISEETEAESTEPTESTEVSEEEVSESGESEAEEETELIETSETQETEETLEDLTESAETAFVNKSVVYEISYVLNGGKNHSKNPTTYEAPLTQNKKLYNPTRTGYRFVGWYKESDFQTKVTDIQAGTKGDLVFYAKWTRNKYNISFKKNGGTGSMESMIGCKYTEYYTLPKNKFKRVGYRFLGWSKNKRAKSPEYKNKSKVRRLTAVDGETVALYAVWQKITPENAKVGDVLLLGNYYQEKKRTAGKSPVQWIVLEKEEDRVLLISKYVLNGKPFNERLQPVTWGTCTIRAWMNGPFFKTLFNTSERGQILNALIPAATNPKYKVKQGKSTYDRVFLLSGEETRSFFPENKDRICKATAYATAQGVYTGDQGESFVWYRSIGRNSHHAAYQSLAGKINYSGSHVFHDELGIRPCVYVSIK